MTSLLCTDDVMLLASFDQDSQNAHRRFEAECESAVLGIQICSHGTVGQEWIAPFI